MFWTKHSRFERQCMIIEREELAKYAKIMNITQLAEKFGATKTAISCLLDQFSLKAKRSRGKEKVAYPLSPKKKMKRNKDRNLKPISDQEKYDLSTLKVEQYAIKYNKAPQNNLWVIFDK